MQKKLSYSPAAAEKVGMRGGTKRRHDSSFGKTVFLTREEAEKALEAMKDD